MVIEFSDVRKQGQMTQHAYSPTLLFVTLLPLRILANICIFYKNVMVMLTKPPAKGPQGQIGQSAPCTLPNSAQIFIINLNRA